WLAGHVKAANKNDERQEILHAIFDSMVMRRLQDAPRSQRKIIIAQTKTDAIRLFMQGEFESQKLRGSKRAIAGDVVRKTADAATGALILTGVTQGIGAVAGEGAKDFGGLIDDI